MNWLSMNLGWVNKKAHEMKKAHPSRSWKICFRNTVLYLKLEIIERKKKIEMAESVNRFHTSGWGCRNPLGTPSPGHVPLAPEVVAELDARDAKVEAFNKLSLGDSLQMFGLDGYIVGFSGYEVIGQIVGGRKVYLTWEDVK